jgi:hypothetical protein
MKFYEIDNALCEATEKADSPVRLRVSYDINGEGRFETVFEQDILEANFYCLKEAGGGTSARGEILLDNTGGLYGIQDGAGREVRVSFSLGEGLPYFRRFIFYADEKGFQDIRGPGRTRRVFISLRDLSYKLRRTDEAKDWTNPAIFTYAVICDKTQPGKSLLHGIVKRAGLAVNDIDCATIPLTLPYVKLTKNIWAELSGLATAYRCHLECAPEKPLVFAHSPYQAEPLQEDEISHTFTGEDIFYLCLASRSGVYRNTVRLKINLPVALEKQEIWRYADPPVIYDQSMKPLYPFRSTAKRDIENEGYEARYSVKDSKGQERNVVYADSVDTKEEAENRLEYEGGDFSYTTYDAASHHDRALVRLQTGEDGDLYTAAVFGRPIVLDVNRSCFLRDSTEIQKYGTAALNVTGSYFSEDEVNGRPQYEDWTGRELAARLHPKREITVKTHRAVFHGRVGARVKIETRKENYTGVIESFTLRYKKEAAFEASFKITEE